jgi:DNA repair exonuclease SbcCD ATPase subunit
VIVRGLRAQNLLKYAHLELAGLPSRGVIAVTGPNEAGKTSIGEIICLALFGQSFGMAPSERHKAIKWGETKGSVELDFDAKDGLQYTLTRYLDRDGGHDASLCRSTDGALVARGVDAVHQALLRLSGFEYGEFVDTFYLAQRATPDPYAPGDTVKAIVGVGAMERAAREITEEIERGRQSVEKRKQEIATLNLQLMELDYHEGSEQQLRAELQAQQQGMADRRQKIEALQESAQGLDRAFDEMRGVANQVPITHVETPYSQWHRYAERLSQALAGLDRVCGAPETQPLLEAAGDVKSLSANLASGLKRFVDLQGATAAYRRRIAALLGDNAARAEPGRALPEEQESLSPSLQATRSRHRRSRYLLWVSALAAACAVVAWGALTVAPTGRLARLIVKAAGAYLPGWHPLQDPSDLLILTALALTLTLAALLLLARTLTLRAQEERLQRRIEELGGHIERLRKEAEILDSLDQIPLPEALYALRQIEDEAVSEAVRDFIQGPENPLLDDAALNELFQRLGTSLAACEREVSARLQELRGTSERLAAEVTALADSAIRQQRAIDDEQEKRRRSQELARLIAELNGRIAEDEHRIAVRKAALGLISEAGRELVTRFDRDLQAYLPGVISRVTANRYHYLQIADDFRVRAFSTDKRDFADLDELSSGTQRQIALALRLALAAALADVSGQAGQSLILDEPFAFFDRERTRETLEALPSVSERVTQIWLISQALEGEGGFAMHIECAPGQDVLVARGA